MKKRRNFTLIILLLGNNGNSGIFDAIEKESPTFTNGIVFNMGTKTSIKIPRA